MTIARYGAALALLCGFGFPSPLRADECPNRGQLDDAYCDANKDLVADVPAKTRDPSVIVFAYTPVEDPAVYENSFKPFTTYLSQCTGCLLYTSPSPRDRTRSRMPSSA